MNEPLNTINNATAGKPIEMPILPETNVFKFHQFIHVERGPVQSAIIDLLKGNVYQVENQIIDKLENRNYDEIAEFLKSAEEEQLIINIHPQRWIPQDDFDTDPEILFQDDRDKLNLELQVEEGINLEWLLSQFEGWKIAKIFYYGIEIPNTSTHQDKIIKKEKNSHACTVIATVDGNFHRIDQTFYAFNKKHNSCWGQKIAFTSDGKVKPCIYSEISVMDFRSGIDSIDIDSVVEKLKEFWNISKNSVEKCKDCELRHICFDCREIARKQSGNLFASNPLCKYDPYTGIWYQ